MCYLYTGSQTSTRYHSEQEETSLLQRNGKWFNNQIICQSTDKIRKWAQRAFCTQSSSS